MVVVEFEVLFSDGVLLTTLFVVFSTGEVLGDSLGSSLGDVDGLIDVPILIFVVISVTSKKMVCKSDHGNITIMYNNKTITGYTASGLSYDFDEQKKLADEIGSEAYLNQFENWFKTNTTGSCTR